MLAKVFKVTLEGVEEYFLSYVFIPVNTFPADEIPVIIERKILIDSRDTILVLLNSKAVSCEEILLLSALRTIRAFQRGKNIAKNFYVEFLLSLFGDRQIKKALAKNSLKKSSGFVLALIISGNLKSLRTIIVNLIKLFNAKYGKIKMQSFKQYYIINAYNLLEKEIQATYGKTFSEKIMKCTLNRSALIEVLR